MANWGGSFRGQGKRGGRRARTEKHLKGVCSLQGQLSGDYFTVQEDFCRTMKDSERHPGGRCGRISRETQPFEGVLFFQNNEHHQIVHMIVHERKRKTARRRRDRGIKLGGPA